MKDFITTKMKDPVAKMSETYAEESYAKEADVPVTIQIDDYDSDERRGGYKRHNRSDDAGSNTPDKKEPAVAEGSSDKSSKDKSSKDKSSEDIDFTVVRENTEGLYAGAGGTLKKGTADEVAIQESINTRKGVERCLRYAFDYCRKRNKDKKLTLCGKTNVLTFAFDLWERAFYDVAKEYSDIKTDYAHVDATCMWMVKNPEWFDVIVTDNMFGDIITDLGAMIQGGMGIAAGGNINPDEGGTSMFEPIGGSAPKYTGKNVINPMAAICAGGMMLEHLGESKAADDIEKAVIKVVQNDMKSLSAGKMGHTTSEIGDIVANEVAQR